MKAQTRSHFLLVAAFVIWLPFVAHAQFLKNVGVKFGVNSSSARLDDTSNSFEIETGRRTGVQAALFAEWFNAPSFSLVTQVEYVQRGFSEEQFITTENSPEPVAKAKANSRLDYVSLPLLVKLRLPEVNSGPYLVVGPRVDFLVNRVAGEFDFPPYVNQFGLLVKESATSGWGDFYNDHNLGGTAGVGFASGKFAGATLQLEVRYNFDFTDQAEFELLDAKNHAFDLWLGVAF